MGSAAMLLVVLMALAPVPGTEGAPASTVSNWTSLNTSQASVQKVIVDLHNQLRRSVSPAASNMLQMVWNQEAANNSAVWAKSCSFSHSPNANRKTSEWGCGENLFMSSNPRSWDEVVHSWYDEVTTPGFQYGTGAVGPGAVGHYTQVVWYKSHQVGCAVNYCPNHPGALKYLYVCHYCPAGNLVTRINKPYDLGTPCQACPQSCDNNLCTNPCLYVDKFSNCPQLFSAYGCGNDGAGGTFVQTNCPAKCRCTTEVQ
ncbi:unnamed protein product [Lampetra fluviatilis]